MSRYNSVIDFNKEILGLEDRTIGLQPIEEGLLSVAQLREEVAEFEYAINNMHFVDSVDAVIDGIYFAYGILFKMGFSEDQFNEMFKIVHTYNMTKRKGKAHGREQYNAADAEKPEDWSGPEESIYSYVDNLMRSERKRKVNLG